jgi:DNA polymerase III epsilon subunit-like protein
MLGGVPLAPFHFFLLGAGISGPQVSSPEQQQPPAAPTDEPPDTDEPPETDATTDTDAAGASEAASSLSTDRPVVPPNAFERTVLCFDTETAGFSPPAICQLAYSLYKNGQVTHFNKILRLPVGVTINKAATEIHGITNRQVATEGWPAGPELLAFWELVQSVYADHGTVLGHNVSFDCRAFNASVQKHGITLAGAPLDAADMFCTMSASSRWSTLTTKRGGRKNFKLAELYEALHGQPPHWARLHNALDDVHVTVACYYTGAQKGWW